MSPDFEALSAAIPAWMARENVPGLAVAVVQDRDVTWTRGFGLLAANANDAVTPDTTFEAASLSKQVFAYAVLKLCEAGTLELDRPLREYLDHDYVEDARANAITARHVLSHTTGFPNWRGDETLRTHFAPGSRHSYSGEGFQYLQHVVDALVDAPVHAYVERELTRPLGMRSATFLWPQSERAVAKPHDGQGKPLPKRIMPEMNAAYSLHCSVSDYARFLSFVLTQPHGHPLRLSEASFNDMLTPQVRVDDSISWGLGWGLHRGSDEASAWQWGSNQCTRAFVLCFPESGAGAVFMANSDNGFKLWSPLTEPLFGQAYPPLKWVEDTFGP